MENVITKDMTIQDIIDIDMELADVFFAYGMFCIGCAMSSGESLEDACEGHGVDCDELVKALNIALSDKG